MQRSEQDEYSAESAEADSVSNAEANESKHNVPEMPMEQEINSCSSEFEESGLDAGLLQKCKTEDTSRLVEAMYLNGDRTWALKVVDRTFESIDRRLQESGWADSDYNTTLRVVLIGPSGNGKSTLANRLSNGQVKPLEAHEFVSDTAGGALALPSSTSGIMTYICEWHHNKGDMGGGTKAQKCCLIDCEGSFGRVPRANIFSAAAKRLLSQNTFDKYETVSKIKIPMMAYSMAQVVVYVMRGSFQSVKDTDEVQNFAKLCAAGVLAPKPYLILVRNRCPTSELPDVGKEDISDDYFEHKKDVYEKLMLCFRGVSVYCIPEIPKTHIVRKRRYEPSAAEVQIFDELLQALKNAIVQKGELVRRSAPMMSTRTWLRFVKEITLGLERVKVLEGNVLRTDEAYMRILQKNGAWKLHPLLGWKHTEHMLFYRLVPDAKSLDLPEFIEAYKQYLFFCFRYIAILAAAINAAGDGADEKLLQSFWLWANESAPCTFKIKGSEDICGRYRCMHNVDGRHHGKHWVRSWYTLWVNGRWCAMSEKGEHQSILDSTEIHDYRIAELSIQRFIEAVAKARRSNRSFTDLVVDLFDEFPRIEPGDRSSCLFQEPAHPFMNKLSQ